MNFRYLVCSLILNSIKGKGIIYPHGSRSISFYVGDINFSARLEFSSSAASLFFFFFFYIGSFDGSFTRVFPFFRVSVYHRLRHDNSLGSRCHSKLRDVESIP